MSNDDFISFEKALRDLNMQSEQLKKLVSDGDIRAFREGNSMKFRKQDVDSLRSDGSDDEEEIVFADALDDDAGMVTEELSEDTLLAEDDLLEDDADDADEEVAAASAERASASRSRSSRIREQEDEGREPTWVIAASILGAVVALYGVFIVYSQAVGNPPDGLMSLWKPQ